jgi:uncharacterized delta-60 repeat protein
MEPRLTGDGRVEVSMGRGARRLVAALASLLAVAALVGATATAAGPAAEKLKLSDGLGSPGGVIADGKSQLLLLGGYREQKITRIGRDGKIDRSFGNGGHVEIYFAGVTVAPDGKILVAGCGHPPGDPENSDAQVTRLLPDGSPDPSFGTHGSTLIDFGGRYDCAESTAIATDGDILVGGNRTNFSDRGSDATPAFARLDPNGGLDRSFGNGGVRIVRNGYESGVYDIAATPDGGILGIGEDIGARLWKLTAAGSLDPSFGSRGTIEIPGYGKDRVGGGHSEAEMLSELTILPSGKILVAGTDFPGPSPYYRAVALRLMPNGHRDRSFGTGGWAVGKTSGSTFVGGMTMLPGGVLLLAASSQYNQDKRSDIGAIAFGPEGKQDPQFGHRGQIRVDLHGFDNAEEQHAVTTLGDRAVILGYQGEGKGTWLVTSPQLRGP